MVFDYEKLGLKSGIEIHQQIDSKTKLFCNCPTLIRDDQPDVLVRRRLRASAGETGEVDVAAKYEQGRQKYFIYQAYNDSTCDVELDDEPIHELNSEALEVVLQAAALTKARVVDLIQVMRKTVVDGSNTSGFQRTALVARNGFIETSKGRISIPLICIEEEAAKIVERTSEYDVYNLSRLGIPLIEIATGAEIKSPEQLKEVAEHIGMIVRSTGKVKRGLGTIRQDVNVSIREGARVEIKGAQDLRLLPRLLELEVGRQVALVEVMKELNARKAAVDSSIIDLAYVLEKSESMLVKETLAKGGKILALRLKGFKGLVGKELMRDHRLGTELSDYGKAFAGVSGAIHSDELPNYGITAEETAGIAKKMACGDNDAFIFVAAPPEKASAALKAIAKRAEQALKGVPEEVRKANEDGTTTFLRPMPGSSRMYPETDIQAIKPDMKIEIPTLITEKAREFEEGGISKEIASQLSKSAKLKEFEFFRAKYSAIPRLFLASTLLSAEKEIKARYKAEGIIRREDYDAVFNALNNGSISKEAVIEILAAVAKGEKFETAVGRYRILSDSELEAEIKKIVAENKGAQFNALIGKAMGSLRGKADSKAIIEKLKKFA
ncbi:MAG: Glu-tRNA(Gln) amidotransferase subunit GatE [Candidatus Woesearchaeota archaeon]